MTASPEDTTGREPAQASTIRRLYSMIEMLRIKDRTVEDLIALFDVPRRTVLRDLSAVDAMGLGLQWSAVYGYRLPAAAPTFRPVEALMVHAALRLLYHHASSKNREYLLALEKLISGLPPSLQEVTRRSVQDLTPQLRSDGALERVGDAWVNRRYIAFDYMEPNGLPERCELAVYFIEISRADLAPYVIGIDRQRRAAVRTFRLSRMKRVVMLEDTYEIPADFDPRLHLTDAWGVVGQPREPVTATLRFAQEAASRVLEGGFPNLTVEEIGTADHSLVVKVRASLDAAGQAPELLSWILGWGAHVEILDPPDLRERWLQEAQAITVKFGRTIH
ncbi:WYL domain-containing protein [uncultured Deinococcus sp.]|uniref:helix-turn-helix transcriptional regulator n=1 Tax=uncultured Deinococcus sp. TaxID=158789 RepID=UPI00259072E6|nr:WYL domain-containing protein [uncultured Deinococcus sp.]